MSFKLLDYQFKNADELFDDEVWIWKKKVCFKENWHAWIHFHFLGKVFSYALLSSWVRKHDYWAAIPKIQCVHMVWNQCLRGRGRWSEELRIRALPQRERLAGSRKNGQTHRPAQKLPPMQPLQRPERVLQAWGSGWGTMMQLATLVHGTPRCPETLHLSPFPSFSPACYTQSYLAISPHTSLNQVGAIKQQLLHFLTSQVSTPFILCLYAYCLFIYLSFTETKTFPLFWKRPVPPLLYLSRGITLEETLQLCSMSSASLWEVIPISIQYSKTLDSYFPLANSPNLSEPWKTFSINLFRCAISIF